MAIHFSISRRATLATEKSQTREVLTPRLQSSRSCNVVDFINQNPWPSKLDGGDLSHSLAEIQRILLHELADGSAVTLPGIGTFQVSIKGTVHTDKKGGVTGCDVRVDGLRFVPDKDLLQKVRAMDVDQQPEGLLITPDDAKTDDIFQELFARQASIQHRDVMEAFGWVLSAHRTTTLLQRLTAEGRLIREGTGSQTRYRAAEGQFVKNNPGQS